jgi:hypothetical protein
MIPPQVMAESREKAHQVMAQGKPVNRMAAAAIVAIWLLLAALTALLMMRLLI